MPSISRQKGRVTRASLSRRYWDRTSDLPHSASEASTTEEGLGPEQGSNPTEPPPQAEQPVGAPDAKRSPPQADSKELERSESPRGRYWDRTSDLCRVKAALSR